MEQESKIRSGSKSRATQLTRSLRGRCPSRRRASHPAERPEVEGLPNEGAAPSRTATRRRDWAPPKKSSSGPKRRASKVGARAENLARHPAERLAVEDLQGRCPS